VLAGAPGAAPAAEPWTPVLAIGSNAGPEQLARKFPPEMFPTGVVVPAVRAVLEDFDVVYAPLISSYGSCTGAGRPLAPHAVRPSRHPCMSAARQCCWLLLPALQWLVTLERAPGTAVETGVARDISHPAPYPNPTPPPAAAATLEHAPGTAVELFVTFLTPRLLARMHATEGAYLLCRLSGVCLHLGASLESRRCACRSPPVLPCGSTRSSDSHNGFAISAPKAPHLLRHPSNPALYSDTSLLSEPAQQSACSFVLQH
jgi:hypothetical protein